MVRLKLKELLGKKNFAELSQFHYGSIKTYGWFKNRHSFDGSLNSTMVRLKQYIL